MEENRTGAGLSRRNRVGIGSSSLWPIQHEAEGWTVILSGLVVMETEPGSTKVFLPHTCWQGESEPEENRWADGSDSLVWVETPNRPTWTARVALVEFIESVRRGYMSALTKEANIPSSCSNRVSGLSYSTMLPRFITMTRSAVRMVCTRCCGHTTQHGVSVHASGRLHTQHDSLMDHTEVYLVAFGTTRSNILEHCKHFLSINVCQHELWF